MTRNQPAYRECIDGVWYRQCTMCYRTLPETLEYFYITGNNKINCPRCRDCNHVYEQARYQKNKERDGWLDNRRIKQKERYKPADELRKAKRRIQSRIRARRLRIPTGRGT